LSEEQKHERRTTVSATRAIEGLLANLEAITDHYSETMTRLGPTINGVKTSYE